jgi:hypothetical protein
VDGHAGTEGRDLLGERVAGFLTQARGPVLSTESVASWSRAISSSVSARVSFTGDIRAACRISSE